MFHGVGFMFLNRTKTKQLLLLSNKFRDNTNNQLLKKLPLTILRIQ